MSKKVIFIPSVLNDVIELAPKLRAEDVMECRANGHEAEEALKLCFFNSTLCYSAKVAGRTECMFGLSEINVPKGIGVIWCLGSDKIFEHKITMVREGRNFINRFFEDYTMLYNLVDARNERHIAWLKHLGFTFLKDPIILNNYKFLQFYKTKE